MHNTFELFEALLRSACILRLSDPTADGQAFWQLFKVIFSPHDHVKFQWTVSISEDVKAKIMSLPEFDENGDINEVNHFLIQSVRLPTGEMNFRRLMQIALNIGQYVGSGGERKEWMKLENYVSPETLEELDKFIMENEELVVEFLCRLKE
jgi:hypothetical protein